LKTFAKTNGCNWGVEQKFLYAMRLCERSAQKINRAVSLAVSFGISFGITFSSFSALSEYETGRLSPPRETAAAKLLSSFRTNQ
jgi:hypothetical protein